MFYLNQIYLILWLSSMGVFAQEGLSSTISASTPSTKVNITNATESSVLTIPLDTTNSPATSTSTATATATTHPPPSSTINSVSSSISLNKSIPTSTVAINAVNAGDEKNLPLWELIYPDQISTFPTDVSKPFFGSTITENPNKVVGQEGKTYSKLFKVDDVTNCEKFFGECLRQVLQRVMPKLQNNNNAADIQFPIDPFYLNRTSFQYNGGGPLNGYITVGNAFVHGLTSMKFGKILFKSGAKDSFKIRLSSVIPTLYVSGSYKTDLKLNSVNVRPKGNFNITLYGVAMEQLAAGEIYRRDEHSFLRLTTMNATAAVRKAKLNATGLIQDTRLNQIILNVTNQYWREILNILLPETRDNWTPVIRNAINAALSMVPFDFFKKA